ncbi:MAG: ribonuclease P protein component [Planctomycetaceae bacterium]|nr:ribonuclease P protein component [Planctomycetaceae bacterium]
MDDALERLYFRKTQRISSKNDFARILAHGRPARKGNLRLYAAPNELTFPRFGISVSKSCGSAVQRNRLKRLVREVLRTHQHQVAAGYDYILIFSAKKPAAKQTERTEKNGWRVEYSYKAMEIQVMELLERVTGRR